MTRCAIYFGHATAGCVASAGNLDMEDYGRGAGTGSGAERAVWVTIGEYTAFGPAPLAICRAALAALSPPSASSDAPSPADQD